ncbi:MAG: phosphoribosylformylglycinamidine synthase I [Deltaproteobacteria bacterium]|jgi:phosphoribosylformylglycinamidine synthase|nr:phosphoribosylformylglycinamidine synthase I [Deltaproteobacteria bacterium]
MSDVNVVVLTGYGLNCDHETAYGFELAGAKSHRIHINALIDGSVNLDNFEILVFGGGFSWGDDHGAGVVQALRMRTNIGTQIQAFVERGNLVIGICNGFQTLVNMGLLPGFAASAHDGKARRQSVALTYNDCGNFRDAWVRLRTLPESGCIFTRGLDQLELPVRHGEGKFMADEATVKRLFDNGQVVLQYIGEGGRVADGEYPYNPNGSLRDIAGICDATGRVFGLMPHPEGYNHWTNHPDWTRRKELLQRRGEPLPEGLPPGIRIFKNAVDYLAKA